MPELREQIGEAMNTIKDPCSLAAGTPLGLDEMGLVKDVAISPDGKVTISLRLTSPFCHMIGFFKSEAVRLVAALPGVSEVELVADNGLDWSPSLISPAAAQRRQVQIDQMSDSVAA